MNAFEVVGYAFEADVHCVDCTPPRYTREDAEDREGNPVMPIFAGDADGETCGDCGELLL